MLHSTTLSHVLLVVFLYICTVAALTDRELEKIINTAVSGEEMKEFARYPAIEELGDYKNQLDDIDNLSGEDSDDFGSVESAGVDGGVRKRPFCNGFTGCGRLHGKRSDSSLLEKLLLSNSDPVQARPSVAKRPFCNGFFGCGNPGKRIVFRNANLVNQHGFGIPNRAPSAKRFFCNPGAFGCANPGKRSAYKTWFDNVRSQARVSGMSPLQ